MLRILYFVLNVMDIGGFGVRVVDMIISVVVRRMRWKGVREELGSMWEKEKLVRKIEKGILEREEENVN